MMVAAGACSGKARSDCDKYVAKRVELATQGRVGADRDDVAQRVRAMAGDACHGGNVSAAEVACVLTATNREQVIECALSAGDTSKSESATSTKPPPSNTLAAELAGKTPVSAPEQRVARAMDIYYGIMLDFTNAYFGSSKRGRRPDDCETTTARVEAMLKAAEPKRAEFIDLVADQAIGKAVIDKLNQRPSEDDPLYDVQNDFGALCIDGRKACCGLSGDDFYQPMHEALMPHIPKPDVESPSQP